ncbi:MAG: VWA domain-containing protein [Acidobacteria bacterium]|nr:VWA domain-containing protein [Acidobacteriota bacterium]
MSFTRLEFVYYIAPCFLVVILIRWKRTRHFLGYPRPLRAATGFSESAKGVYLPIYLQWVALVLLAVSVLNPVLSFAEREIHRQGLDIVLVSDLSASMQEALPVDAKEAERFARVSSFFAPLGTNPSRMDAVKVAVKDFIRQRRNDRIGLVVFSSNSYVVSPMTLDYESLFRYVDMMDHRTLIGEGMTAIGEGIHAGVRLIARQNEGRKGKKGDRLLIVLTDGENNYGRSPVEAVQYAAGEDCKIYLIGVDVPLGPLTRSLMAALQGAGGLYYDVRHQQQLNQAYWEIGALEKGEFTSRQYDRNVPFFHALVLISFGCLGTALALRGSAYFTDLS